MGRRDSGDGHARDGAAPDPAIHLDDLDAAHQLLDVDLQWSGPDFTRAQRRERLAFAIALAQRDDTGRLYGYRAITLKRTADLIGLPPDLAIY
jgi:hypothetical protein